VDMNGLELPSGIWESLLPNALSLIDEIRTHGGVADPFFTFGGGTVLMLRYGHRLSKDIDFFVPDPQYFGYISPRLSDVAESMCDGYEESGMFVKLNLPEGEIDFVASTNLLPSTEAFESWTLFDQHVRVETAAEIVAKKMWHRGHQGTARDLFDLAMVAEREPAALLNADPFMYRHMDAFLATISAPGDTFRERFAAIQTLNYEPTLDHAVDVASKYLGRLQGIRDRSLTEANEHAEANGFTLEAVDVARGEYRGPIFHQTARHVLQDVGRRTAVVHEIGALPASMSSGQTENSIARIRYSNGEATGSLRPTQSDRSNKR